MTPEQREFYQAGYRAGFNAGRARKWSAADIETLIRWTGSTAALAEQINRTPLAIRMKRHKLRKTGEM